MATFTDASLLVDSIPAGGVFAHHIYNRVVEIVSWDAEEDTPLLDDEEDLAQDLSTLCREISWQLPGTSNGPTFLTRVSRFNWAGADVEQRDTMLADAGSIGLPPWGVTLLTALLYKETTIPVVAPEDMTQELVDRLASIVATAVKDGFASIDSAIEAVLLEYAGSQLVEKGSSASSERLMAVLSQYEQLRATWIPLADRSLQRVEELKRIFPLFATLVAPLEMAAILSTRAVSETSKAVNVVISQLVRVIQHTPHFVMDVGAIAMCLTLALDVIDVAHRRSPKPAWAMLFDSLKYLGRTDELLMAQLAFAQFIPASKYEHWADRMFALMDGVLGADVTLLSRKPPTRGLFFPSKTFGIKEYEDMVGDFEVEFVETRRERKRLEDAIKYGGQPAMDQAWWATIESSRRSLARYTVDRPTPSSAAQAAIIEAADALFDEYPEMYDAPKFNNAYNTARRMEWKYAAGVPFMREIMKRSMLRNSSWFEAIQLAANRMCDSGVIPEIGFHAFPKNQLVSLDSLRSGKNLRYVVAGDRIMATYYNMFLLERNKRPPPNRALVLTAMRRTEGGMQALLDEFKGLIAKDWQFWTGDATQFDSTVVSELAVEGPVQLYRRGTAGMVGAERATSHMKAYYQALSKGIIVNLMDSSVVHKTGGGGTGSIATSVDNRDWVRIALMASWTMVTGRPSRDFFSEVRLSNASDDIAMVVSPYTAQFMEEWKACMYVEYGIIFTFDQADLGRGILHLIPVEADADSADVVEEIAPGQFRIRHDPARLFQMRSDYRADRVSISPFKAWNAIAEQDCGHIMLTAYSKAAYHDIAVSWMGAVGGYMSRFFKKLETEREIDSGYIVNVSYFVTDGRPAPWLERMGAKRGGPDVDAWMAEQQAKALKWYRARRLHSYDAVLRLWVAPPPAESAIAKRYKRYAFSHVSVQEDMVRLGLGYISRSIRIVPKALDKMIGEYDLYRLTVAPWVKSNSYVIERFVYACFVERMGRAPQEHELLAQMKISPYGTVCDTWGFVTAMQNPEYAQKVHQIETGALGWLWLRVLIMQVFYALSNRASVWLAAVPILGVFIVALFIYLTDFDKLYSLLSLGFWLLTGTMSLSISNLVSKDPYYALKLLTILFSHLLADEVVGYQIKLPGLWNLRFHLLGFFHLIQTGVKARFIGHHIGAQVVLGLGTLPPAFARAADEIIATIEDEQLGWLVTATMGAGKSTTFPAAFLQQGVSIVVLLMPTNALVLDYANRFVDAREVLCVTRFDFAAGPNAVPIEQWQRCKLVVMTAGTYVAHATSRDWIDAWPEVFGTPMGQRVVLIDEIAESQTEQAIALHIAQHQNHTVAVGLTGTAKGPICGKLTQVKALRREHASVTRRFADWNLLPNEAIGLRNRSFLDVEQALMSQVPASESCRWLVVVPTIALANKWAASISATGVTAQPMHSSSPTVPSSDVIVATTIVDKGMNITPPPLVLLDSGLTVVHLPSWISWETSEGGWSGMGSVADAYNSFYQPVVLWTSMNDAQQRWARVGRTVDGLVVRPSRAGSGHDFFAPLSVGALVHSHPDRRVEALATLNVKTAIEWQGTSSTWNDLFTIDRRALSRSPMAGLEPQVRAMAAMMLTYGGMTHALHELHTPSGLNEVYVNAWSETPGSGPVSYSPIAITGMGLAQLCRVRVRGGLRPGLPVFNPFSGEWLVI